MAAKASHFGRLLAGIPLGAHQGQSLLDGLLHLGYLQGAR
jgi:hypothetical protein